MSDHGQVPTVIDEDAVTMPWGDLAEFFFGGMYEQGDDTSASTRGAPR